MTRARNLKLIASLLLAALTVLVGGLSVHRKVQTFETPGFRMEAEGALQKVGEVLDPATGLQKGDVLVDSMAFGPDQIVQRLRQNPTSELKVFRNGQDVTVAYHRPALQIDFPFLLLALAGAVYLLIGLYTVLRDREGRSFLFCLWCLASAVLYLMARVPPADAAYRLIYLFDEAALLLLPALTLHLFLVFPAPLSGRWVRRSIPFLYLPGAVLLTLQLDSMRAEGLFGPPSEASVRALQQLENVYFAVLFLAAAAVLIGRYLREDGLEESRQMRWMVFGVAGGYLPFIVLNLLPLTFGLRWPTTVTTLAVVPLALVPLTFAYAILRYKLWDIEVIARNTISWTLTLLFGIIGFSLVNLAISRGISVEMTLARNLLSFGAGLGIAGLLMPTRTAISGVLERLHYRDTFGKRRALSDLGRELLLERDLGRLAGALLRQVEEAVDLDCTNLYLVQSGALQAVRPEAELAQRLAPNALGTGLWQEDHLQIAVDTALPCQPQSPRTQFFAAGYRYAFPLTVRGRRVGLVFAGSRRDGSPLSSEDASLIRHLLNQAALAIENAQLLGQLSVQLEEVRRLQNYTEGIFESSPAGIAVLDGERRVVSANAAFAALAGIDRQHLPGCSLESVLPVQPLPALGEGPVEASFADGAGPERHLQLSLAMFEPERHEGLTVLVVHDVTERVAMENALREKDRLAALGLLAAGVAHEVNTPITGISSYAQMLLEDTPQSDPHYEILKKVERQTFRAARIVNNLLEFARNRQNERAPVAVAPLVSECLDLLGERLGKRRIEVEWTPPAEKVLVMGCDGELQQVLTNLILNALDAMSETGGRLSLGVAAGSQTVLVSVRDNGPGIPAEKLDKVFQPFFSTKLNRGGTGLGLSVSHDIVQRHGGDLKVASTIGEGACFTMELPRYVPATQDPV